ncbi:Phenylalanine--tRNA ligase beta subunit [Galdieria sulphuraria]|nr:Phenylalanine--tRNA ligase beta subunit [Galdieria sulphuraria]
MPTVTVDRELFLRSVPGIDSDEDVESICYEFGLEVDEVCYETWTFGSRARSGIEVTLPNEDGKEEQHQVFKIEVPANRTDLLSADGIIKALRVFRGIDKPLEFSSSLSSSPIRLIIKPAVQKVRQYMLSAVVRGVVLNRLRYQSIIDFQEKLHQNICRQRSLVSIGLHDLDKVEPPFVYDALRPTEITFVPLGLDKEFRADQLFEYYDRDPQLRKYTSLIRQFDRFPVVLDAKNRILSLPPVINGDLSKVTLSTRNIFVDCTGTDWTKTQMVIRTIVAIISQYCEEPFVEPVIIETMSVDQSSQEMISPNMELHSFKLELERAKRMLGVDLLPDKAVELLNRMQLFATIEEDSRNSLHVQVPIHRDDILHTCDIIEDLAVAYGYDNLPERFPCTVTQGRLLGINMFSDLVRREGLAQQGFTEVLTWVTVSQAENFDMMQRPDDGNTAVRIANPKTLEFQSCRFSLLPGILKTLRENRMVKLPIRLFELSDTVHIQRDHEVGAVNRRSLCAVYCSSTAGFELIHGLLEHIMKVVSLPNKATSKGSKYFWLDDKNCEDNAYFPGRRALIMFGEREIGVLGWIHPQVLQNFGLNNPCSALELDIDLLFSLSNYFLKS